MEPTNLSMEMAEFGLGDAVRLAIDDAMESVRAYHATILWSVSSSLPERIVGEPHRLRQIVTNLLIAAARLTPAGQVKLSVFCGRETDSEIEIAFEISVNPDSQETRAAGQPTSESGVYSAESLLPASRKLVQHLGGEMGVQVDGDGPPVLWCRIPVQHSAPASQADEGISSAETSVPDPVCGGSSTPINSRPAKILMAEDNVINQRVGKLILRRAGYEIELVSDGIEAVEAHLGAPFDVILMDCQMPTMDGFEATRRIRSLNTQQPVIIAVTANALVGERERCLEAGMDDYLSKPFQADQLVSMVNKWVQASSQS